MDVGDAKQFRHLRNCPREYVEESLRKLGHLLGKHVPNRE